MKISDVENFFNEVDQRINFPLRVILTGGAAGVLYGMDRATYDIDFEAHLILKNGKKGTWDDLQKTLEKVSAVTHITPQFADNIDRWSSIALPVKKARLYKRIGKVEIRILEPSLWAVGKLTRFLSTDIEDLVTVLKSENTQGEVCVRLWGQALGGSPPSPSQTTFRRQVEYFLEEYSQAIWGKKILPESLKKLFLDSERIKKKD